MSLLDTIKKMFGTADTKLKPVIEYYDDGKIERAYSVDKNWHRQGPYEDYHKNGQLWAKCTYKDGKKDGPYESYHENGQLCVKCTYKDGKKNGPHEEYYENGQLKEKCTYKDGELDGPHEKYYENGQLKEINVYKKGVPLYGEEAAKYLKKNYPIKYKELQIIIKLKEARNLAEKQKAREKARKEQEEKEAREKPIRERKGLNARLAQMDKQMPPTQLRRAVKRAEVAKFRAKFPNKKDGR